MSPYVRAARDVRRDEPEDLADPAPRFIPMGMSGDERARAKVANAALIARVQRSVQRFVIEVTMSFEFVAGKARVVIR